MTVEVAHLVPAATAAGLVSNAPSEELLWSYLIQLTSVLRSVHTAGLYIRPGCLSPTKVGSRAPCDNPSPDAPPTTCLQPPNPFFVSSHRCCDWPLPSP
jgi:hypothetical protein